MDNIKFPYDSCKDINCSECRFTNYGQASRCEAAERHKETDDDKIDKIIFLLENVDSDFIHVEKLLNYIRGL